MEQLFLFVKYLVVYISRFERTVLKAELIDVYLLRTFFDFTKLSKIILKWFLLLFVNFLCHGALDVSLSRARCGLLKAGENVNKQMPKF